MNDPRSETSQTALRHNRAIAPGSLIGPEDSANLFRLAEERNKATFNCIILGYGEMGGFSALCAFLAQLGIDQ